MSYIKYKAQRSKQVTVVAVSQTHYFLVGGRDKVTFSNHLLCARHCAKNFHKHHLKHVQDWEQGWSLQRIDGAWEKRKKRVLYLGINKSNNKVLIQKLPAVFTFHKDPNILSQLKRGHQVVQGMMHIFRNDHNSSISPSYIKLAWHYIVRETEVGPTNTLVPIQLCPHICYL